MTVDELIRKDSWILAVIRDRCELTNAEKDYLNILIGALEEEPKTEGARGDIPIQQTVPPIPKGNRVEYGTDGKPYKLSISDGKEYEKEPCEDMKRKVEKEYLFESLCEDLKKLQAENENLRKVIDKIPKTNWIPASKLPPFVSNYKISDDVLITNGYDVYMGYLVERKGKIFWYYYGAECDVCIEDKENDAIAWMPLPIPPKESELDEMTREESEG